MSEELCVRIIYGSSLAFHNFFANLPLGIAIVQCCFCIYYYATGWSKSLFTIKLTFDILVLSILLSVFSGFALEIEFERFWPNFKSILSNWNQHIGHLSAVISYFLSSLLIIAVYYYQVWTKPKLFILFSLIMVVLAWFFGAWGIFLNTVMQYPFEAAIKDGELMLDGTLYERFFSGYHIARQSHIAASSILKGSLVILIIYSYCNKAILDKCFKPALTIIIAGLLISGITGHLQAVNISKHQPSKFAAMEGIATPQDTVNWNVIGLMLPNGEIRGASLKGGLQLLTNNKLRSLEEIPSEEQPPVVLTFNSFRIM